MTSVWTTLADQLVNQPIPAAWLNNLRNNGDWLRVPPQTYADITSVAVAAVAFADAVTLASITTTGLGLLIGYEGHAGCSAAIGGSILGFDVTVDGVSVGGANGVAQYHSIGAGLSINTSFILYVPPVTAAAHIIKLRAKISAGTATLNGSTVGYLSRFWAREI